MDPKTENETPENPETPEAPAPDSDEALYDAVSAAVDAETQTPESPETPDETPETDGQPDGDPKPAEEAESVQNGKDKAGGKDEAKPEPNHVDDPIPDDIKGRTRERMEGLIAKVKESSSAAEKAVQERDELIGYVNESKATPEQFGQALDYLRLVNSGDPESLRKALKVMQGETAALARMLGEPVAGVDLLSGHDDLKAAVDSGELTQQHAEELAASRESRKLATERSAAASTAESEQQQFQAALTAGKAALNQLEATLKSDPQYAAKRTIIVPILKPILAKVHPSQWAAQFKAAYDSVTVPAQPAAQPPGSQPMRARQPAGGAVKAATTMEEAMEAGIARAGR